jgi:hypothetical protein
LSFDPASNFISSERIASVERSDSSRCAVSASSDLFVCSSLCRAVKVASSSERLPRWIDPSYLILGVGF